MYGEITTPGIVLSTMPVGEYDRRVSLLTAETGRISAFARGARRATSPLTACTLPFTYAEFTLNERRDAYDIRYAENIRSFAQLYGNIDASMYGAYFCEILEYLTRENTDEKEQLKLLYMTLAALNTGAVSKRLVKCVFEIRALANYGEAMKADGLYYCPSQNGMIGFDAAGSRKMNTSTLHAVQYIESSAPNKLFSFTVKDEILDELEYICTDYLNRHIDRPLKSLEVLKEINDMGK